MDLRRVEIWQHLQLLEALPAEAWALAHGRRLRSEAFADSHRAGGSPLSAVGGAHANGRGYSWDTLGRGNGSDGTGAFLDSRPESERHGEAWRRS